MSKLCSAALKLNKEDEHVFAMCSLKEGHRRKKHRYDKPMYGASGKLGFVRLEWEFDSYYPDEEDDHE